jgi:hypothetical protein
MMKRIIRSRGYGKTLDLIDYAVKNDAIIVCYTQTHCRTIEHMAEYHKGVKVETMCFQDVMDGKLRGSHRKVVIDEMELTLRCVFNSKGAEVIGYNMSME